MIFSGANGTKAENGETLLFKRSLNDEELSPGEKYLLRLCMVLYGKEKSAKDSIYMLLLDEPETHLHPGALINFIDKLDDKYKSTQIIVVTHSTALLAHWFRMDVFELTKEPDINGNCIKKLRSDNKSLLNSLFLGVDTRNHIDAERNFLAQSCFYSMFKFAFECFDESSLIEYMADDKQLNQLYKVIYSENGDNNKTCCIIDFGAGYGRLLHLLKHKNTKCEYYAYDVQENNEKGKKIKAGCKKVLKAYYNDNFSHYYIDGKDSFLKTSIVLDLQ